MSNSTTLLDTISVASSNKESLANALFDASSPSTLWGRHASACNLLVWGYYGGNFTVGTTVNSVANGTVTLTASTTNYLQASPTTGAVSANTTGFTSGQIPLYSIVTNATTVTSYTDCRSYQPSATASSGGGSGTVTDIAVTGGVETNLTSGADITTTGTIRGTLKSIPLTGTYAPVTTDRGSCYTMSSASANNLNLPTPTSGSTSNFPSGWYVDLQNRGAGTTTITVPTGITLDGVTNGTLAVPTSQGCSIFTDGTGWFTLRGIAGSGGGGGATTLTALTDVSVADAPFNDSNVLGYFSNQGKWIARPILLGTIPNATYDPTNSASQITLSNGNLTATANTVSAQWSTVRSLSPHTIGRRYAEFTVTNGGTVNGDGLVVGIMNASGGVGNNKLVGQDTNGVGAFARAGGGVGNNGLFYNSGIVSGTSGNFAVVTGSVIGVAVDFANKKAWFYNPVAGQWNCDVLANQNPATNTGGFDLTTMLATNGSLYLAASVTYNTTAPAVTVNPGSSAFSNAAPAGFSAWSANTSALVQDVAVAAPNDGDHMVFNGASGKWVNVPTPDGEGFVDGNFDQWNVNTTFSLSGNVDAYTSDMWICNAGSAGAATVSRRTRTPGSEPAGMTRGNKYQLQFNATGASGITGPSIGQKMESVTQYNGQSVTVSGFLGTVSGTSQVTGIRYTQNFGTGGSPSSAVTATTSVTWNLTTTEQRFSALINIPSINGKTLGTNGDDNLRIDLVLATGTTFNIFASQLQTDVTPSTASANTTGTGGIPQRFRYAGLALESQRSGRYLRPKFVPASNGFAVLTALSSTVGYAYFALGVKMRAVPAGSYTGGTPSVGLSGATGGSVIGVSGTSTDDGQVGMNMTGATAGTSGYLAGGTGGTTFLFDARL